MPLISQVLEDAREAAYVPDHKPRIHLVEVHLVSGGYECEKGGKHGQSAEHGGEFAKGGGSPGAHLEFFPFYLESKVRASDKFSKGGLHFGNDMSAC
jgi:hypothetical protein